MTIDRRVRAWLSVTAGIGLLLAIAPLFLAGEHLPEPLATHFGFSGAPDGNMSRPMFSAILAALVLLVPGMGWVRAGKPWQGESRAGIPALLGIAGSMSAVAANTSWFVLFHNWDRAVWSDARRFGGSTWLLMVAVPLLAGGGAAYFAHRRWPSIATPISPVETLPLEHDERAYWSGSASNRGFALLVGALVLQGALVHGLVAGASTGGRMVLAVYLLALSLVEHLSHVRVSVDERALSIRYGRLGWIKQRILLERIAAATAFELEPWEHGGWGYRGSLKLMGRAAVVVRSGCAIRLDLRDGTRFSVTVDDAATAARLINGFLQRRSEPSNRALQKREAPT